MGKNPSRFSETGDNKGRVMNLDTSGFPVECVNLMDAEEFCRKLNEREQAKGRLVTGWEYRLPTEAQWEYACRAGTTTATAFDDALSSKQANFRGEHPYNEAEKGPNLRRTVKVGSYQANAWGLHDMHGNVSEWCQDWYAEQLPGGLDPLGPASGEQKVARGGAYLLLGHHCRTADRGRKWSNFRSDYVGFRVALVPGR